jgi:type VI secretion system secreted protein Hcp
MKKVLTFTILSLFLISTVSAAIYIKIPDIPGESSDREHDKWIDVLSIDWGAHRPETSASAREMGKVNVDDFTFTKHVDKSTPKLSEPICKGERLGEVEVHVCEPSVVGGESRPVCYLKYKLDKAFVKSYSISGGQDDNIPVEEVSFGFTEIKIEYDPLDAEEPEVTSMCQA